MIKLSKRNRKRKILITLLLVAIILFILVHWLTRNEAEKMVRSCHKVYEKSMKLEYVSVDGEKGTIKIYFETKDVPVQELNKNMSEIYQTIIDVYFNEQDNQYEEYSVNIYFSDVSSGMGVTILNITKSLEFVEFWTAYARFSIKDIANLFPYIRRLKLEPAYYDDITEIEQFSDLSYIFFSQGITYEEEKYILSIFPDCVVDAQGYQ